MSYKFFTCSKVIVSWDGVVEIHLSSSEIMNHLSIVNNIILQSKAILTSIHNLCFGP